MQTVFQWVDLAHSDNQVKNSPWLENMIIKSEKKMAGAVVTPESIFF